MNALPNLSISSDHLCFIIVKARQFDAKEAVSDDDSGSNPTDDSMIDVLEDHGDDPTLEELTAFIDDELDEDQQIDLVTLSWLGRGDGEITEWEQMRAEAARDHNQRTAAYLLGMPLLSDYLEDAMNQFGLSCDNVEKHHL